MVSLLRARSCDVAKVSDWRAVLWEEGGSQGALEGGGGSLPTQACGRRLGKVAPCKWVESVGVGKNSEEPSLVHPVLWSCINWKHPRLRLMLLNLLSCHSLLLFPPPKAKFSGSICLSVHCRQRWGSPWTVHGNPLGVALKSFSQHAWIVNCAPDPHKGCSAVIKQKA